MKTTLLVSTYNRPDLLARALRSASAQSVPPDEAVICDDGSKVDMVGPLKALKPELAFPVRFVTQADDRFRLAKARNNGVRVATGDLIISTDQDIIFSRGFIETYAKSARRGRFLVAWPVRLTQTQTEKITDAMIADFSFEALITGEQRAMVRKQWRKDAFYSMMKALRLRRIGPKLRGGVFAAWRDDYLAVNGFDEQYIGWGNEDDDLGHRLARFGVTGLNPFRDQYPVHLWHPTHNEGGTRPNVEYYRKRLLEIAAGDYRCRYGIESPLGEDTTRVVEI